MTSVWHDLHWVLPLRSEAMTAVMNGFTALGYVPFFLACLPLGYWLWDKGLFTRLAVLVVMTALLNAFLKDAFHDPRPDPAFALDARVGDSYGMPSGHAQVAAAMWLWLAYELRRAWVWVAALAIVAGVSFSRLYLGVHDVEDVVIGLAAGFASLAIFRLLLSDRFRHWHDLHPLAQLALLVAVQPIVWLAWPGPDGPGGASAILAFLLGWWAGVLYDRHRIGFRRHQSWTVALVAATLGIAFLFAFLDPLQRGLVAAGIGKTAAIWIQMLLVALYVTVIAPALFRAAGAVLPEPMSRDTFPSERRGL
ncbi:phosphatase PAP2 family protein [Candidatus Binatia bacterium]|nr:phosphatase PAP2 family protein [Candidatus Binatia bacterium]